MSDLIIQLVGNKTNDIYCNILSLCVTLTAIIFQILLCPPHPPQLYLNSQLSQGKPRGLEQVSICTQIIFKYTPLKHTSLPSPRPNPEE